MKKIFTLFFIFLISIPAFAAPGYHEFMESIGGKTRYYDDSEAQAYWDKLEKEFYERHPNSNFTGEDYDREVRVPYYDFSAKLQKMGYPGYIRF